MNLVVDANIIFAALIKESKTTELLLDMSITLYTPEYILLEIEKHQKEILTKTSRSKEELEQIMHILKKIIRIIPQIELQQYIAEAKKTTPDPDDIMYFALALKLHCPIWSNDKALKKQDRITIYSTPEIIKLIK
ncbi:MAG: PIN domain-containing protein [Candidatus Woesearchaeota archaeon]